MVELKLKWKRARFKILIEALTKIVWEMKKEIKKLELEKDEEAVKSFQKTSFFMMMKKNLLVNGFILIKL